MNKSIALVAVGAAALLASAGSFAKGDTYIQAQLGTGSMKLADKNIAKSNETGFTKKNDLSKMGHQIVPRLSLGHYFVKNGPLSLGAELGFTKYGAQSYKAVSNSSTYKVDFKRQDIDLMGVAKYDINDKFFVDGKLGVAYASQKVKMSDQFLTQAQAEDGLPGSTNHLTKASITKKAFKPKLGIGAGYNISDELAATVSYDHTFGKKSKVDIDDNPTNSSISNIASTDVIAVGLTYSF